MSEYSDLQSKAAKLGMTPVVGKSKEELETFIKQANQEISEKDESPKETPKYNAAAIMNGTSEVRRYTLDIHGVDFADLAEQFITKMPDYTVKLIKTEPPIQCPACGHKFSV